MSDRDILVGGRYLSAKTGLPLTVRYIGPLPPSSSSQAGPSQPQQTWYGVEYDDPSHGKGHSGTYKGTEVFRTRQMGAGAFVKAGDGALRKGKTFVRAVEERYGVSLGVSPAREGGLNEVTELEGNVLLGSSGITVEAPGIADVQKRVGRLEKLREMGLEVEWVCGLGGSTAERTSLRERLKGLTALNSSRNLFSTWEVVAEVVGCLPSLKVLVLNDSRISPLPSETTETVQRLSCPSLRTVEELHLHNAGVTWQEVLSLVGFFPSLRSLHLGRNALLKDLDASNCGLKVSTVFKELRLLNLDDCSIANWMSIVDTISEIPHLETLSISSAAFTAIPARLQPPDGSPLPALAALVLLDSSITLWTEIDHLANWLGHTLQSLRISLKGIDDMNDDVVVAQKGNPLAMSGLSKVDRPFLIAKLESLEMLNLSPIPPAERRDAEMHYISFVRQVLSRDAAAKPSDWGRYEYLCSKHGQTTIQNSTAAPATSLRSKMITLHIYPARQSPFDVSLIPNMPMSSLRTKISRKLGVRSSEVGLWTVKQRGEGREKVAEMSDEGDVKWWFENGDDVVVEVVERWWAKVESDQQRVAAPARTLPGSQSPGRTAGDARPRTSHLSFPPTPLIQANMLPSLAADREPLLPPPATATLTPASRSKLAARRYLALSSSPLASSSKVKGKQRAPLDEHDDEDGSGNVSRSEGEGIPLQGKETGADGDKGDVEDEHERRGRAVIVIFSNEGEGGGGNLEVWVEEGETVGSVKDQIRHLRPSLQPLSLRLIHSGRLLTDGILLLPWLRSLEERVRRQASSLGGDVEFVLKDVGLAEEDEPGGNREKRQGGEKVWLHCNVGGVEKEKSRSGEVEEPIAPRRRGFDVLLDAGLSAQDVANMRRQFYESRGEEVPEGLEQGDVSDEHARALEEQWIEGDLTADTATKGMYTSILHGLLTGFLLPFTSGLFFRESPLPNFFDAEAHAAGEDDTPVGERVSSSSGTGAEAVTGVVFGKRMQMGILLGTVLNLVFGALRFLN